MPNLLSALTRLPVCLAFAGLVFGGLPHDAQAQSPARTPLKVRLAVITTSSTAAVLAGVQKGIFAKHGFDVEVKTVATGVQATQALAADQVDWSETGIEATIVSWATALPFTAYSMYAKGGDSFGLVVRKSSGIKTIADLKGKRVAVTLGTSFAQGLAQVLVAAGLPSNSVQRVNATIAGMGPMLVAGSVDAMVTSEPFVTLTMEQMGDEAVLLTRLGKYVQGGGFFLISNKWAAANPQRVADVVEALWEAQQYARRNQAELVKMEAEFLKIDPRIIEIGFRYLRFDPIVDDFTQASIERSIDYLFGEGLIATKVNAREQLEAYRRVAAELEKRRPELLQ